MTIPIRRALPVLGLAASALPFVNCSHHADGPADRVALWNTVYGQTVSELADAVGYRIASGSTDGRTTLQPRPKYSIFHALRDVGSLIRVR